ncbi:hypothetical protein [Metasolibacillus meyeri]|uniref:hypothetical protein n=1 Tax=Metasolibacillus meyeri TaxID=1071052 RepID=UPI000D30DF68|nr:hypothetical protein [Metasolibacillus meyeri]
MSLSYNKVNEILNKWASNSPSIIDFTVENVLYEMGLGDSYYENVFKYLMSKDGFEIIAKKILLCPNNHKCDEFLLSEPIEEEYFDCYSCDENDFEPENFMLVFSFTDDFIMDALKKKSQLSNECIMV